MRTFILTVASCTLLLLQAPLLIAQQAGIRFEKATTVAALIQKAKTLKKPIFIDAYATWCGPCKSMDAEVYPQKLTGDYFNKNFINAKFDVDAGEGAKLAEKYKISSIPAYLVISPDGKLLHRGMGYKAAEELVAFGKQSLDNTGNYAYWENTYTSGKYKPSFLLAYAHIMLNEFTDLEKAKPAFDKYIAQPDIAYNDSTLFVLNQLLSTDIANESYKNLYAAHAKDFTAGVKEKRQLYMAYAGYFLVTHTKEIFGDQSDLNKLENDVKAVLPEATTPIMSMIRYSLASDKENPDMPKMLELADKVAGLLYDTDEEKAAFYNDLSWKTFELNEEKPDEGMVKAALKLSLLSIALRQEFANTDTAAQLYGLLKDKANAIKYGKQALELAEKEGMAAEDTQKTRDLVNQLAAN
ncbi:thioredoxin family protein [Chitinophaga pendula]|uniref:thioredoxin family protein n=1 Tax=Chitinophaga TaxID=79328 RepID=UPI0012FDCA12|nr:MULTISPECIES: thioredoxin family protein [Chitinophaga]UCJ06100.1 thioredoxin family protein [Chitinophaga pendula]